MPADDVAAADWLDRSWDDVVRRGAVHPGGLNGDETRDLDGDASDLALAVRRLHDEDDAPAPDRRFAARLGRQLGLASEGSPAVAAPAAGGGRATHLRLLAGSDLPLSRLAAAAAILLAILGGRLFGLGDAEVPAVTAGPSTAIVGTAIGAAGIGGGDCPTTHEEATGGGLDASVTPTAYLSVLIVPSPTATAVCRSGP